MSNMKKIHEQRELAIGEMAISLVRYINYEIDCDWSLMHYDDRLEAIIKWFTADGDDDQTACPHDWVGEALSRRHECADLIARVGRAEADRDQYKKWYDQSLLTQKSLREKWYDQNLLAQASLREQVESTGLSPDAPVIADPRSWEQIEADLDTRSTCDELRILELEYEVDILKAELERTKQVYEAAKRGEQDAQLECDLARRAGHRIQEERNKLAVECAGLADEVDKLRANLSIRTTMLELVEARLNKYVVAEEKAKREGMM